MGDIKAAAVALGLVAALGLAACGGDDGDTTSSAPETTATTTGKEARSGYGKKGGAEAGTTIVVRNGEPVGGVEELEYGAGEQVEFTVESDVADEVHVHGYDLSEDVEAGGAVSFSFPAEIEGIFEVELEETAVPIAELRVNP